MHGACVHPSPCYTIRKIESCSIVLYSRQAHVRGCDVMTARHRSQGLPAACPRRRGFPAGAAHRAVLERDRPESCCGRQLRDTLWVGMHAPNAAREAVAPGT